MPSHTLILRVDPGAFTLRDDEDRRHPGRARRAGTEVLGLHLGGADTDMMAGYDGPLLDPDVVRAALGGLEAGQVEVLVDDWSRTAKAGVAADQAVFYAHEAKLFS